MTNKARADRLVEAGIGRKDPLGDTGPCGNYITPYPCDSLEAKEFCQDGRVVLAVEELHDEITVYRWGKVWRARIREHRAENENRRIAIIDACLDTMEGRE